MNGTVKDIVRKPFQLLGYDIHRVLARDNDDPMFEGNQLVPDIWRRPAYLELLPLRLRNLAGRTLALIGSEAETSKLARVLTAVKINTVAHEWEWHMPVPDVPADALVALCKLPTNEEQWRIVKQLKERFRANLLGLQELVLPLTTIRQGQESFTYTLSTLENISPYYAGEQFYGPLDRLNELFPLAGKSIIEFGPMEGAQTSGLVRLGASSVTCIEARAESYIKTMIAKYALGWDNVNLVMDDFHNADNLKYGTFDLAFAHGVYYHSLAPFFFFENLMSLSNRIFIGGYIYVPGAAPQVVVEKLSYQGRQYQAKKIPMGTSYNTGVNQYGYHFTRDDLVGFFTERGYQVTIVSEDGKLDPWGDAYLRFLATK